ncbi:MAG: formyltetrahydrofolate deformylase [Opitutales bacterium]
METPVTIARLHGPDRPGLVAAVASWITERGGNIEHADQHRDAASETFFQRVSWVPAALEQAAEEAAAFAAFAQNELGMQVSMASSVGRPRVALFVSKTDHCLHELCLRFHSGELRGELCGIIGNHAELEPVAHRYGVNFHHIPTTAATKAEAEAAQLALLRDYRADLVVMARYMQVLSDDFLRDCGCPVINIHHSFLPAFAGGRPYHQAFDRGVKLIGATAHYATADLDEGPIIHQDVTRITHRHQPNDLIQRGRDLEKIVLAQAVKWHLEHRVLVYGNKTVVFD